MPIAYVRYSLDRGPRKFRRHRSRTRKREADARKRYGSRDAQPRRPNADGRIPSGAWARGDLRPRGAGRSGDAHHNDAITGGRSGLTADDPASVERADSPGTATRRRACARPARRVDQLRPARGHEVAVGIARHTRVLQQDTITAVHAVAAIRDRRVVDLRLARGAKIPQAAFAEMVACRSVSRRKEPIAVVHPVIVTSCTSREFP